MSEATKPLNNRQSLQILLRAARYIYPFRKRYATKFVLVFISLLPPLIAPFLAKITIDNVINGMTIEETIERYPFFLQPVVNLMAGLDAAAIMWSVVVFSMITVALFGFWGSDQDGVTTPLGEGQDPATRSENEANSAYSFAGGLFGWLEYRLTLRLSQSINHLYRSQIFQRIQNFPITGFDNQRIGDTIYRMMYDAPYISEICYKIILTPTISILRIITIIMIMGLTFGDQPLLVWVGLSVIPLMFMLTLPFSGIFRNRALSSRASGAATTTNIEESVTNVQVIQSMGAMKTEENKFDNTSWNSFSQYRRQVLLGLLLTGVGAIILVALGLIVFYEATDLLFVGTLTAGDLGVLLGFYTQIVLSARAFGAMWIELQDNIIATNRAFELMDNDLDHQPQNPAKIDDIREGFEFVDVGFNYPDGTPALNHISFKAKRGEMIALVGPAGAGKTTLAYMFPRFLWPSHGEIRVDGQDMMSLHRDQLRQMVSFVFQEPSLLNDTIEGNLRLAKPDASEAEIEQACEIAGALEFIRHLPQGFKTPLGRNGGRLSVGQKQRLSIARALLRDTPVLILDEPTAALDPMTEYQLVAALRRAAQNKLVIVIAHRLSTIRHADQILFIEGGNLREIGNHQQLMQEEDGAYRRFVDLQTAT